ncbi:MAG: hypothetical protein IJS81_01900 [Selenomonadaceae bacterium]|nr:hypothetical protein [Selenomonadaceae bacterium]
MMLRYKGDGKFVSFVTNEIYNAKKIVDEMGEGYAIFDEGGDWYRYGVKFVEKNFELIAENNTVDFSELNLKFA